MYDITQTITKRLILPEGWRENDNQGMKDYELEALRSSKAITELFNNPNVEIISMDVTVNVNIKTTELKLEDDSE